MSYIYIYVHIYIYIYSYMYTYTHHAHMQTFTRLSFYNFSYFSKVLWDTGCFGGEKETEGQTVD